MADVIEYRDDTHEYFLNGSKIWNVTDIMAPLYQRVFRFADPEKLEFGTQGHLRLAKYERGELKEIEQKFKLRLDAWIKCKTEMKLPDKPLYIEGVSSSNPDAPAIVISKKYRFAGRPDLVYEHLLVDWKFSETHCKLTRLQTAAYLQLIYENTGYRPKTRVEICLKENGDYSPKFFRDFKGDFNLFRAQMLMENFMRSDT